MIIFLLFVLAIDLYDQKVATNREDAAKYIQSVKKERAQAIIRGAFALAGKQAIAGEAKRTVKTKEYDAEHGFANPGNPNYDSEATRDAYKETLAFLKN